LPSFSGVNWSQYVAKSERTAPFVEMLPTNFFPGEPPSPDPELDPEPVLEPEVDPELAPDPDDASDPKPELPPNPELEELAPDDEPDPALDPDPEVEPGVPPAEPEPEEDAVAPLPELEPVMAPTPPSSVDDWLPCDPDCEPHAIKTDAIVADERRRERATESIDRAVAARGGTRQRIGGEEILDHIGRRILVGDATARDNDRPSSASAKWW
jgi:hypothetical protein